MSCVFPGAQPCPHALTYYRSQHCCNKNIDDDENVLYVRSAATVKNVCFLLCCLNLNLFFLINFFCYWSCYIKNLFAVKTTVSDKRLDMIDINLKKY